MKFKANFQYKPNNFQMDDCQIEKVVELPAEDFSALLLTPLRDHPAVTANKDCMFSEDGVMHCLLALSPGRTDGLDTMLQAALERRPEVATVDMRGGGLTTEYHHEFCRRLQSYSEAASGIRLRDVLPFLKGGGMTFLCHETAECSVLAENLRMLTEAGQQDHEALLNARVSEICPSLEGVEVVLTGVEPEELVRFNEAYDAFDAFVEAERSMGPVM